MEETSRSSPAPARHDERRRSPRIEILGRLHGQVVALNVEVVVREMSLGGMSLEGPFAFPTGAVHEFRLTLGDRSIVVKGRVAHCSITDVEQEQVVYTAGIEFIEPSDRVATVINEFIDAIQTGRRAL